MSNEEFNKAAALLKINVLLEHGRLLRGFCENLMHKYGATPEEWKDFEYVAERFFTADGEEAVVKTPAPYSSRNNHDLLITTLEECARVFSVYAKSHAEKGTSVGYEKAASNARMVENIASVLERCK